MFFLVKNFPSTFLRDNNKITPTEKMDDKFETKISLTANSLYGQYVNSKFALFPNKKTQ